MSVIHLLRKAKIESVSFQSGDSEKDKARYYFSVDACQTEEPNDQNYLFMPDSVESTIDGYSDGQPVMVNHHTWGIDGLGFGATVSGEYKDPEIVITGYIALGFGTPSGPFTNTDELAKAVEEGFVDSVSVHGKVLEAMCSICGNEYNSNYYGRYYDYNDSDSCNHVRGFKYAVKKGEDEVLETCIVQIVKFEPQELSFVWSGSDSNAKVRESGMEMAMAALSGVPYDVEKRDWLLTAAREQPNNDESSNPNNGGNSPMAAQAAEVLQAQLDASEVKVESLQSQIGAKDTEIATLKASIETLEKEKSELKAAAQENERLIADGKIAREKAIAVNLETFTKIYPDTSEADLQVLCSSQKESLETFSIEQIYKNTQGYQNQVDVLYPEGRVTTGGADDGDQGPAKRGRRSRR